LNRLNGWTRLLFSRKIVSFVSSVNFGMHAARVSAHNKLSFYVTSVLTDSAGGRRVPVFANAVRAGSRYEVNITRRSFTFSFTDFEHDQIQGLNLRLVGGGGMGFNLIKNPKTSFQVFSGGSVNREHFQNGVERQSREFVLGNDFVRQLNRNVSISETLFIYPNLSERGQYRVNLDFILKGRSWVRVAKHQ
jgi:putative salt-induced outer membrane protein